jgi:hypothetical protein
MSRAFFDAVNDALVGFIRPALRTYEARPSPRNLKVWFEPDQREHYEVQLIGRAALMRSGLRGASSALEIGFHAEHAARERNEAVMRRLRASERSWRRALGREPEAGEFIGMRAGGWMRLSELWVDADASDDGAAIEAADRLARYIVALEPARLG